MRTRRLSRFAVAVTVLAGSASWAWAQEAPPNIVWIWADNLAYADLGCYGSPDAKTPNVDRLAKEGVRFTQYYTAHTVCSPARAALLTGRQPARAGIVDVLRPDSPSGLPPDEITLAEALQDRGYATAAFGKWHLGDRKKYLPLQHGFDYYFGLPYSMDMLPTLLYRNNEVAERLPGDAVQGLTERLTDGAIRWIEEPRDQPFFLYFSHTLPHPPLNLPAAHRDPDRSTYDNALTYMDEQTGRLLDALGKQGLEQDTLVIFSSDNGPMVDDGDTGGLRGRIRDAYEGGVRVPFIARWPGRIPVNRKATAPAIAYDIFPTLIALAGGMLPENRRYAGQDIRPLLTGAEGFTREQPFYWVYRGRITAMRDGPWKLHVARRQHALDTPELYNLAQDPGESKSVAADHPEVVSRMTAAAGAYQADLPKVWSLYYPVRDPEKRPSGVRRE